MCTSPVATWLPIKPLTSPARERRTTLKGEKSVYISQRERWNLKEAWAALGDGRTHSRSLHLRISDRWEKAWPLLLRRVGRQEAEAGLMKIPSNLRGKIQTKPYLEVVKMKDIGYCLR